jgi:hypothetical protein
LYDPEAASTTLLPVPAQAVSAACTRLVSSELGGDERCEVVNCAVSVSHTDGKLGWLTLRLSPVATVCAPAHAAESSRIAAAVVRK